MSDERSSVSVDFEPTTFWMDDLNAINNSLKIHQQIVTFKIGKVSYESFESFSDGVKGKTINELTIFIDEPSIDITLAESSIRLYARGDLKVIGTAFKITELMRSKARTPIILYEANAPTMLLILSMPLSWSGDIRMTFLGLVLWHYSIRLVGLHFLV